MNYRSPRMLGTIRKSIDELDVKEASEGLNSEFERKGEK
jgi:hypothetical protein